MAPAAAAAGAVSKEWQFQGGEPWWKYQQRVSRFSTTRTDENKLVAHLKSPDFFDVANFPTATFEIASSEQGTNTVYGNLTIRGITESEVVENVIFDSETKSATGTLIFDRQKYGVAYKGSKKDMLVGDEVEMTISLKTD